MQKEAQKAKREKEILEKQQNAIRTAEANDPLKENYKNLDLIQSQVISKDKYWVNLKEIQANEQKFKGKIVLVRCRVHGK